MAASQLPFDVQFIISRAKAIIVSPKETWQQIKSEPDSIKEIYIKYLIPLSALGAICGFIGRVFFGIQVPLAGVQRTPFFSGLIGMIVSFALGLAMVYLIAMVLDFLSASFGGRKSLVHAVKLVTYSMTPGLLAGILNIFPHSLILMLGGLFSLYGLYIFYHGVEPMMEVPAEKKIGYIIVSFIVAIGVSFIINLLVWPLVLAGQR